MAREVLVWGLPPELETPALQEAQRLGLSMRLADARRGLLDTAPVPGLVVVGVAPDAPDTVAMLRARRGWQAVPVLAVMTALEAGLVAPLRGAGVVRIMMQDEFLMELPSILRGVG
jgi:hypothetical protein